MEENVAIKFCDIEKSYNDKVIISDFNLDIEKGEFLTIIGSSGSGKTTILKMINGLIEPNAGKVLVNNRNIKDENIIELRRNIGYAIQGNVLFPHMNVEKNIAYVLNISNQKSNIKESVKKWLKIVDLDESILERYPDELSGGQQQRVGIARALIASPNILLMDEPFGAVDEITRGILQEEIKRIHQETKITIVFITHDILEAINLGTKILIMDNGEIQQYDMPENIIKNPKTEFVKNLIKKYKSIENM